MPTRSRLKRPNVLKLNFSLVMDCAIQSHTMYAFITNTARGHQFILFFQKKMELDARAARKTNAMTWVGLGLMSVQFGILARLTWWEYSWDIMEPVTYFVTYGTAMAAYAYFVLTKQVS